MLELQVLYTAVQVYIFCMQSIYRKRLKQRSINAVAPMIATQSCMCLLPWYLNYCKFINLIFNDVSECSAYRIPKHTIGVCHGWSKPVLVDQASSPFLMSGRTGTRALVRACCGEELYVCMYWEARWPFSPSRYETPSGPVKFGIC